MAKYGCKFKKKVVEAYLRDEGWHQYLTNKYAVKTKSYTLESKLSVVEWYLTTEISYQKLALNVEINNPPLITKWVNGFRIASAAHKHQFATAYPI